MAKSRAQRKAEQRKRRELEAEQGQGSGNGSAAAAQHDTQVPESGEVAEVEAALEAGAARADVLSDESVVVPPGEPAEIVPLEGVEEDIPGEDRISRRDRRRQEKEREQRVREQAERRTKKPEAAVRERGAIMGFLNSVTRELGRVQWPDRDTLVQASAVTLLFVAVAAAYLGILDGIFNWLVDKLLI